MTFLEKSPGVRTVSVVSVVFEDDIPSLYLQAQSISKFFDGVDLKEIVICVNSKDDENLKGVILREIITHYGKHSNLVKVRTGDEIFEGVNYSHPVLYCIRKILARSLLPIIRQRRGWRRNDGWQIQQAMKLKAISRSTAEFNLVLDSKNIFVSPISEDDLFCKNGKPRSRFESGGDLYDRWFFSSFNYVVGRNPSSDLETTAFTTPIIVPTLLAKELEEFLFRKGIPIEYIFCRIPNYCTEFMMLSSYAILKYGDIRNLYGDDLLRSYTIFNGMKSDLIDAILEECEHESGKCFGVHHQVAKKLSPSQKQRVKNILNKADLKDVSSLFA